MGMQCDTYTWVTRHDWRPTLCAAHTGLGSQSTFGSEALNAPNCPAQDERENERESISWTWWAKSKSHGVHANVGAVTNVGGTKSISA